MSFADRFTRGTDRADDVVEVDIPRFTVLAYLSDNLYALLIFALAEAGICVCLPVLGLGLRATLLMAIFILMLFVVVMSIGYARRARFYREFRCLVASIDQVGEINGLFESPSFLEGRIDFATASALSRLGAQSISEMRADDDAYRRYIELWIHEIKTPIAAMKLMLSSDPDERSAKLSREIERVESQVDQALYYARSTSVANDYAIKEINLVQAVREACKRNARFLIEHGANPRFNIDKDLTVLSDEAWLVFMLGQVVVNSAKYGATEIVFSAHSENDDTAFGCTVLEVKDNGCGIPSADVGKVFERGFIGEVGRKRGSATGMGLYLVARLCASLGLHVGIFSEEGDGTRVVFTFPHDRARKRMMLKRF